VRIFSSVLAKRAYALVISLAAVLLVGGCAATGPYPQDIEEQDQEFDYVIGPGDKVEVFVWGNPELTGTVTVRPDGKITTRLVEDIPASGKTPSQLARDIEKAYSDYVKSAVVSVIVGGFVGIPSQQVRVVGEASKPLSVPFRKHMTLLDLMIAVGGLTDFADGNKSVLIRTEADGQQIYNVRLDDLIRDGDISANTTLMPGDILIIPEAWF
jgi:polysaccharide export outer membrane protein